MSLVRALLRDRRGATVVEVALLAPIFLGVLFSIVEGGRMVWMKQAAQEAAYQTARCMSIDTVNCGSATQQKNFAVTRAGRNGITIAASAVVPTASTTCRSNANNNRVVINVPFSSPASGLLSGVPATIVATACFPVLA